jgi:hypothetical protein
MSAVPREPLAAPVEPEATAAMAYPLSRWRERG